MNETSTSSRARGRRKEVREADGRNETRRERERGGGSVRETRMKVGLRREENELSSMILWLPTFVPLCSFATQGLCRLSTTSSPRRVPSSPSFSLRLLADSWRTTPTLPHHPQPAFHCLCISRLPSCGVSTTSPSSSSSSSSSRTRDLRAYQHAIQDSEQMQKDLVDYDLSM